MKINGEDIIGFEVSGENSGNLSTKDLKTLKECYNYIQEDKKLMRNEIKGYKETYYINIITKSSIYEGYTLKKYKNRYWLV